MLVSIHFSFLMLMLIFGLGFLLYNFVCFLSFVFVVQYFSCSRQCACYTRSDLLQRKSLSARPKLFI